MQQASDASINDVLIIVIISTLSLALMGILFYLLFVKAEKRIVQEQNQALKNLVQGQETERERLARDIHDDMGPELSLLLLTIDGMQVSSEEQEITKADIKHKLKEAISHIRYISHNLQPAALSKHGLVAAIEELIDSRKKYGISFHFETNYILKQFDSETETNIYRIIEEMIYNTIKHANAKNVNISLLLHQDLQMTVLQYSDDGIGLDMSKPQNGIGIINIRSRVKMLSGHIELNSNKGLQYIIKLKNN